ncbi:MAG TPA: LCP family protein [Nocardioidaceae bacterium]|nr:LCP family protein [Nocardioidaceae bacterium]
MADRPRGSGSGAPEEGTPEYDWLYGTGRKGGVGSSGRPPERPGSDPEPTRVMPTLNRPGDSSRGPAGPPRRAGKATPPPRRPARPRRRHPWRWVLVVLLLWVVFLVAVPVWAWTKITKVDAEPDGDRPDSQPGSTYLLVGSDSREDLTAAQRKRLGTGQAEGRRTDTIMLLHTGSGPNLLLSIPRDSIVDVPGHGKTKVNAAYAFGGPELLVETLESETGIRIDNYVEIGFGGFVNVVDAVGGIEICPESRMNDPLANLNIKKGCQEANGTTALGYARSRHTSALGDIDRARHQREVVSAVGSEALSPWSVLNPVRYFRLASAGADSLAVGEDTGPFDTARFAFAMTRVSGDKGLTCTVPIADLAVHWDRERALEMFGLIKEDRTSDISDELCRPSGLRDQ